MLIIVAGSINAHLPVLLPVLGYLNPAGSAFLLATRLGLSVNQLFIQSMEQYISDHIDELGTLPKTTEGSD